MAERLIVSRHPATVEFIRRELPDFADAPVMASVSAADVAGKDVAGNLPLDLAAQAHRVYAVCFMDTPPRGQEYTVADMEAARAYIKPFAVVADPGAHAESILLLAHEAYSIGYADAIDNERWGTESHREIQVHKTAQRLVNTIGL